jgi:hypothetical protein
MVQAFPLEQSEKAAACRVVGAMADGAHAADQGAHDHVAILPVMHRPASHQLAEDCWQDGYKRGYCNAQA